MISCSGSPYGRYRTRTFANIFIDKETFIDTYNDLAIGFKTTATSTIKPLDDDNIGTLFSLLYARYGNSHIANSDENQFVFSVFSLVFQYGPTWAKKLEMQEKLRNLTDAELVSGTMQLSRRAENPSTEPTSDETLNYVNSQVKTLYTKNKQESYATLLALLEDDVTESFIAKFKKLFLTIVEPQAPLYYVSEEDNENMEV